MTTMGDRARKPIGLPLVILQMAVSAIAFMIVLGTMALVMLLWESGKRLMSYIRDLTLQRNSVFPQLLVEYGGDMRTDEFRKNQNRKAYYRALRQVLTVGVQLSFKEQHERPPPRISHLIHQLDQATPSFAH
jgi:hypothetical protein